MAMTTEKSWGEICFLKKIQIARKSQAMAMTTEKSWGEICFFKKIQIAGKSRCEVSGLRNTSRL